MRPFLDSIMTNKERAERLVSEMGILGHTQELWIENALNDAEYRGRSAEGERALRFREALEAIAADGWIEGCKTRGEWKGFDVKEIAEAVLLEHPRENVPIRKVSDGK